MSASFDDGESTGNSNAAEGSAFAEDALRNSSRIRPARIAEDQVVLEIRPGKWKGAPLLVVGLLFAAIPAGIGYFVLREGPDWIALPFLALFLLVGFIMVTIALRVMFTRTLLLLETGRLVVRKVLFGWTSTNEYLLNDQSAAWLGVAYEQNDQPVYRIEVSADGDKASFGVSLDESDQQWLVDGINSFPGAPVAEQQLRLKEKRLVGSTASVLRPEEVPATSIVSIDRDDGRELHLSWASLPPGRIRAIVRLTSIAVALFIGGFVDS